MNKKMLLLTFTMIGMHTAFAMEQEKLNYGEFKSYITDKTYGLAANMITMNILAPNADPYKTGETPLWLAIDVTEIPQDTLDRARYFSLIRELLNKGANPKYPHTSDKKTPLSLAESKPEFEAIVKLLKNPPALPKKKEEQLKNFVDTAYKGLVGTLKTILPNMLPNIDAMMQYRGEEMNPLIASIEGSQLPAIKFLIENDADVNVKTNAGKTPLMFAAKKGNREIVGALLRAGADVSAKDSKGDTAVNYAKNDFIRSLIRGAAREQPTKEQQEIKEFIDAAGKDYSKVLSLYTKNHELVNKADNNGRTALMEAASNWQPGIVAFLLDKGANVNARDSKGESALFYATQRDLAFTDDARKVVSSLLNKGANSNLEDENGLTPIFHVVMNDAEDMANQIIQLLVDKGADLNKAVIFGINEKKPQTALDVAKGAHNNNIVTYLEKLIKKPALTTEQKLKKLQEMIKKVQVTQIKDFLGDQEIKDHINDVIKDAAGHATTLLIEAVEHRNPGIVQALIDAGADINGQNDNGDTALMAAISDDEEPIITLLLRIKNINVNLQNREGFSALMMAAEGTRYELIPALLNEGANITLKNAVGQTALDLSGNEQAKALLQEAQRKQQPTRVDLGVVYQQLQTLNMTLRNLHRAL